MHNLSHLVDFFLQKFADYSLWGLATVAPRQVPTQGCQMTAVTATFLKCGSFKKLMAVENS
jgi:hypothetical protein